MLHHMPDFMPRRRFSQLVHGNRKIISCIIRQARDVFPSKIFYSPSFREVSTLLLSCIELPPRCSEIVCPCLRIMSERLSEHLLVDLGTTLRPLVCTQCTAHLSIVGKYRPKFIRFADCTEHVMFCTNGFANIHHILNRARIKLYRCNLLFNRFLCVNCTTLHDGIQCSCCICRCSRRICRLRSDVLPQPL